MTHHFIVRMWDVESGLDLEVSLPLKDLDEYFVTVNTYKGFLANQIVIIDIQPLSPSAVLPFSDPDYDTVDVKELNKALLAFNELSDSGQERIYAITESLGGSFDSFRYALRNMDHYDFFPLSTVADMENLGRAIFARYINQGFATIYEDAIDFTEFAALLTYRCVLFFCKKTNGYLLKVSEML